MEKQFQISQALKKFDFLAHKHQSQNKIIDLTDVLDLFYDLTEEEQTEARKILKTYKIDIKLIEDNFNCIEFTESEPYTFYDYSDEENIEQIYQNDTDYSDLKDYDDIVWQKDPTRNYNVENGISSQDAALILERLLSETETLKNINEKFTHKIKQIRSELESAKIEKLEKQNQAQELLLQLNSSDNKIKEITEKNTKNNLKPNERKITANARAALYYSKLNSELLKDISDLELKKRNLLELLKHEKYK